MPKSNHSRNGVKRNRVRRSLPIIRCRFCHQKRSNGHKPGCIGAVVPRAMAPLDGWK